MESSAVVTSPAVLAAVGRRRVIVVGPKLADAREVFSAIMRQHPDLDADRRNGREAIMLPDGGLIRFESAASRAALRGIAADAIFVTDPGLLTRDFVERARPCLATSLTPSIGVLL